MRVLICLALATQLLARPQLARSEGPSVVLSSTQADKAAVAYARDRETADKMILGEALYRVAANNDARVAFAFGYAVRAKSPDRVYQAMQSTSYDGQAVPVMSKETATALAKAGVSWVTSGAGPAAVVAYDGLTSSAARSRSTKSPAAIAAKGGEEQAMVMAGQFAAMAREKRARTIEGLAVVMGRDLDAVVRDVRDRRIINEGGTILDPVRSDKARQRDTLSMLILREQSILITDELTKAVQGLKEIRADQLTETFVRERKAELEHDAARLSAGVNIEGLVLSPLIGQRDAGVIVGVGNQLINMNTALKQFGPGGGLSADKLLMFSNFATAGMAIAGMLMVPKEDPTMAALMAILGQLKEIQKQLARIEGKIDDLASLTLTGFEKVLRSQKYLDESLASFRQVVENQIIDRAQREAIETYLNYLNSGISAYPLAQQCNNPRRGQERDVLACSEHLASLFSDKMIFTTQDKDNIPGILSPAWSNQMLSPKYITDSKDLVVQQLSHPLFFAENPKARNSLIARNHEAATAMLRHYRGIGSTGTAPNPEILAPRLKALIEAAKLHPWFKTKESRPLTEQALARLSEVRDVLNSTVGNPSAWTDLIVAMDRDLSDYEKNVKQTYRDLIDAPFAEERRRFLGSGLKNCADSSMVPNADTMMVIAPIF